MAPGLLHLYHLPGQPPGLLHDHPHQRLAAGHHLPDHGSSPADRLHELAPGGQVLLQTTEVRQGEVSLRI